MLRTPLPLYWKVGVARFPLNLYPSNQSIWVFLKVVEVRILYNYSHELIPISQDGHHAPPKPAQDEESKCSDKEEEVLVVPTTNTVVYPRAVVIKILQK